MSDKERHFKKAVGQLIKRERQKINWTQEELAEAADLDGNNIGRIERGTSSPSILSFFKLVDALDLHHQSKFLTKLVDVLNQEET